MKTPALPSAGRDPVALAIEKYLHRVEQEGVHKFSVKERSDCVRVNFAGETEKADTIDMALIRLAGLLLGREAFREALTKTLRAPTRSP